jgi:hypothetical protein
MAKPKPDVRFAKRPTLDRFQAAKSGQLLFL